MVPSRQILVQSEQLKHWNNDWNLFKVNNKETSKLSDISLVVFFINVEDISLSAVVFLLLSLNK